MARGGVAARAETPAAADTTRPFVIKMHANWCGTCTALEPVWEELEREFGAHARFVRFDVTDRAALARSQREAERLGLAEFLAEHKSQTGTISVLDGATREPVAVMQGEADVSKYRAAIARAGNDS
jgi:thiol-disulfide isomerase/thioredoxin